jgi:hypothetical protein
VKILCFLVKNLFRTAGGGGCMIGAWAEPPTRNPAEQTNEARRGSAAQTEHLAPRWLGGPARRAAGGTHKTHVG